MAAVQRHYDVIIVGAGVHSKSSVGGFWAKEQPYPGLRANNLQGYYEFRNFPMLGADLDHLGVRERGVLSGENLHTYVYEYANHFDLLKRTRLNTKIVRATNNDADATKAWTLELTSVDRTAEKSEGLIACFKFDHCDWTGIATMASFVSGYGNM